MCVNTLVLTHIYWSIIVYTCIKLTSIINFLLFRYYTSLLTLLCRSVSPLWQTTSQTERSLARWRLWLLTPASQLCCHAWPQITCRRPLKSMVATQQCQSPLGDVSHVWWAMLRVCPGFKEQRKTSRAALNGVTHWNLSLEQRQTFVSWLSV